MEEVEVGFHAFLILALGGGEWSPSRFVRFNTITLYFRCVQIDISKNKRAKRFSRRLAIKITVFPVMTPCSMAEMCGSFGRTCCFLRQGRLVYLPSRFPVDGGRRFFFLYNVGTLVPNCTASLHFGICFLPSYFKQLKYTGTYLAFGLPK
jgi:hypothetical protein